jgi:nucleoside-diphosphate-sugar epimerase
MESEKFFSNAPTWKDVAQHFSQIVVYGANGWLGRSLINEFLKNGGRLADSLLLVGSTTRQIEVNGFPLKVLDQMDAFAQMEASSLFFNLAFLRKEKVAEHGLTNYMLENLKIMNFVENVLLDKTPKTLVNASSGAAKDFVRVGDRDQDFEPYGLLKRVGEKNFESMCRELGVHLINCRIYSMTGEFINEFENLALSAFISEALATGRISVKSPLSRRTYVDAGDLAKLFLKMALADRDFNLDSGGSLVTLEQLALAVSRAPEPRNIEVNLLSHEPATDYFGDFEHFNQLAEQFDVALKGIDEQIALSLSAFEFLSF